MIRSTIYVPFGPKCVRIGNWGTVEVCPYWSAKAIDRDRSRTRYNYGYCAFVSREDTLLRQGHYVKICNINLEEEVVQL